MAFLDSSPRQPIETGSAFSFREVSNSKSVLVLRGRALPYRPFQTTVRQRNDYTMLPGYSRASLTLLGPEDAPATINGYWKDKYISPDQHAATEISSLQSALNRADASVARFGNQIGLGTPITSTNETIPIEYGGIRVNTVREACNIVDRWVREGRLLEVTWDTQAFHGIIEEFSPSWYNVHDVQWEMHFKWIGRAEVMAAPLLADELSISDTVSIFQKLVDAIGTEALPPTFPMANDVFKDINAAIFRLADTTQRISDTIAGVAKTITAPAAAVRQIIALCRTLAGQARELSEKLQLTFVSGGQYPRRTNVDVTAGVAAALSPSTTEPIVSRSFSERMVVTEYTNRVSEQSKALEREAVERSREYEKSMDRDLVSVYTARKGDDLRKVSQIYYGTPNEWRRIMSFNELDNQELSSNQVILIPRVTTQEEC